MAKKVIGFFAIACLSSVALVGGANAQASDESMKRLEARLDALAKENASLRSRLTRVEAQPRAAKPKQEPGYIGPIGKPSVDPTPQQVNAAREAFAADMPVATKYAPPPPRPACGQFGGWYVGANAAWAYRDHTFTDRDNLGQFIDTGLPSSINSSKDGFVGGPQAGYNWQFGCTVFGVEGDWSWSSLKISEFSGDGDFPSQDTVSIENKMRWFATARTRAGVVVDNLLLYVTGGLAFANFQRNVTFFEDGPATTGTFSSSKTKVGWTAGVGTEWAFAPNWTLKSEFLYMRFEQENSTGIGNGIIGAPGRVYRFDNEDSAWVTRLGVNYRFGDYGKNPVVARY